ncbi:RNase H family protein [Humibacillus xanthopallidus]|uniref:ribonuclease H n=1 Tax=Humibacillus xanthopallidus TaxID=412689 RepID=A0A543HU04_9MICO|nr:RNase H family protein [Humibacillus xanthopallidus]TQM61739.1 ribonuclease HI [Humibacillus xanthopallidus]
MHWKSGPRGVGMGDEHGNYHASGQAHGTHNVAELNAVLSALRDHPEVERFIIQIDSTYARDCSTTWRANWERNGMRNSKKQPVANADIIVAIWRELDSRAGSVTFLKVPGHDPSNASPMNTAADLLATEAAEKAQAGRSCDLASTLDLALVKPRATSFGKW